MRNIMYLNDGKVAKFFGAHPERGRLIPGGSVRKVTVGVRWSLPKLDYEPDDDVLVRPFMALICLGRGKWEVKVDPAFRELAMCWLMDKCQ